MTPSSSSLYFWYWSLRWQYLRLSPNFFLEKRTFDNVLTRKIKFELQVGSKFSRVVGTSL